MRASVAALLMLAFGVLAPRPGLAKPDHDAIAEGAIARHILPAYETLASAMSALGPPAEACDAEGLRAAYHDAFDAWMGAQHIAVGPIERDMRRFAFAFWPDTKGFTRKALDKLISSEDPRIDDPEAFARVSVAARGLLALERLLYADGETAPPLGPGYRCRLSQAIARDLRAGAAAIVEGWRRGGHAAALRAPGPGNAAYPAAEDVTRALFGSLDSGLQGVIDLRLGRPLGSFERPRPRRAEAWRSRRSLRNVETSLAALRRFYDSAFAQTLTEPEQAEIDAAFTRAATVLERAPRPLAAAVGEPAARLRIEAVQSQLKRLQGRLRGILAPAIGVTLSFNSLDGD